MDNAIIPEEDALACIEQYAKSADTPNLAKFLGHKSLRVRVNAFQAINITDLEGAKAIAACLQYDADPKIRSYAQKILYNAAANKNEEGTPKTVLAEARAEETERQAPSTNQKPGVYTKEMLAHALETADRIIREKKKNPGEDDLNALFYGLRYGGFQLKIRAIRALLLAPHETEAARVSDELNSFIKQEKNETLKRVADVAFNTIQHRFPDKKENPFNKPVPESLKDFDGSRIRVKLTIRK